MPNNAHGGDIAAGDSHSAGPASANVSDGIIPLDATMQETSSVPATTDNVERISTRKPRPKLTIDHLRNPNLGLEDIYVNFQRSFASSVRDVGHEGYNMNMLLSLYDQWRKKFFPIGSFEDFVQRIEKMGPNKECQDLLRQYRQRTVTSLEPLPITVPVHPVVTSGDELILTRQAWALDAEIDDVLDDLNQ